MHCCTCCCGTLIVMNKDIVVILVIKTVCNHSANSCLSHMVELTLDEPM